MPPNLPSSDMQIPKSEKKILGPPPLPNPGDAPGDLPRPRAMILPLYNSKLIVQFQELVEIIDNKYPLAY